MVFRPTRTQNKPGVALKCHENENFLPEEPDKMDRNCDTRKDAAQLSKPEVWCPKIKPPSLPIYSDLSSDAQLVMSSILDDYQRKKEILEKKAKRKPWEPINYYNSVYRGSFNADISRSVLGTSQLTQHHDQSNQISLQLPTFSPTVLSGCASQHHPSMEALQHYSAKACNSFTLENNNVDYLQQIPLDTTQTDKGFDVLSSTNYTDISLTSNDFSISSVENSGKDGPEGVIENDKPPCPRVQNRHEPDVSKTNRPIPYPGETTGLSPMISPNWAGIRSPDTENLCALNDSAEQRQLSPLGCDLRLLFGIKDNTPRKDETTQPTEVKIPLKRKTDVYNVEQNVTSSNNMAAVPPFSPVTVMEPAKLPKHNSVEDAELDIIENILSQECSTSSQKASKRKFRAPYKPSSVSNPHTEIPAKKTKKVDQIEDEQNTCVTKGIPSMTTLSKEKFCFEDEEKLKQHNIYNFRTLSEVERTAQCDSVLLSKEVLLTLVYKDGSTLLSTESSEETKKKHASNEGKKVAGIAIGFQKGSSTEDTSINPTLDLPFSCLYVPISGLKKSPATLHSIKNFLEKLMSSQIRKVTFQAKELLLLLLDSFDFNLKVVSSWILLDAKVAAWLLDSDNPVQTFRELLQEKNIQKKDSPIKRLMGDIRFLASIMLQLFHKLKARDLWPIFFSLETRLLPLLAKMEKTNMKVDTTLFLKFSDILKSKLNRLEKKAHQLAGHSFCINSHPQLRQVIFEELRLDQICKSKTKVTTTAVNHAKSTSEAVLTQLVNTHPLPAVILEYRQLQKLKSTYVDGLMVCVEEGHLQTHWDQTAAATGRLTSYQPNLQSVPKQPVTVTDYRVNYIIGRDAESESFELFARDPFVSEEGYSLFAADFQQIELRLLAHLSDDSKLISTFSDPNTEDIFIKLTSQWLGKPGDHVTQQEREQTKRVVYSVMYGAGKEKLAEYLKIETSHAKAIMQSFLEKFPAINQFTKKCTEFCQSHGYTSTIFKRRRLIPNITSKSPKLRAQAERQAVNFCVQGSAADVCKAAMLQVEHALVASSHINARLLLQIHDELLYEVPDDSLEQFAKLVVGVMESTEGLCGDMVQLKVPLSVSLSVGKRWGHLHPWKPSGQLANDGDTTTASRGN